MRLAAALVLLAGACGGDTTQSARRVRVDDVSPRALSARGAPVTMKGGHLDLVETVKVRGEPVTLLSQAADTLVFEVPPLVAGPADVALVEEGGAEGVLEGVLQIEAIDLEFLASPPGWVLGGPEAKVRDAAALGSSLAVATEAGLFRLEGDGRGGFTWSQTPSGGPLDVRALTPFADGLVGCTASSGPLLFVSGDEVTASSPRLFDCNDLTTVDLDGDGDDDLVELSASGELLAWRNDDGRLSRIAPVDVAAGALSGLVAEAPGREVSVETSTAPSPDGPGLARVTIAEGQEPSDVVIRLPLPARDVLPVEVSSLVKLSLDTSVTFVAKDGTDASRRRGLAPVEGAWTAFRIQELTATEGEQLAAPLQALEWWLTVPAGQALTLELDTVSALEEDGAPRLLAGFDPAPQKVLESPARVLAGSGSRLFAGTGAGVFRLELDPTTLSFTATPVRAGGDVSVLSFVDLDRDGVPDLFAGVSGAQDRALLDDGFGAFFDATASILPLDEAPATQLRVRDFDLDGLPDLLLSAGSSALRLYTASSSGRFHDRTAALGFARNIQVAVPMDVDGDHDVDVVALPERGEVRVFVQRGGAAS